MAANSENVKAISEIAASIPLKIFVIPQVCKDCNGLKFKPSGFIGQASPCINCNKTGKVPIYTSDDAEKASSSALQLAALALYLKTITSADNAESLIKIITQAGEAVDRADAEAKADDDFKVIIETTNTAIANFKRITMQIIKDNASAPIKA